MLFLFPSSFCLVLLLFEISTVTGGGVAAGGAFSLMSACRSVCVQGNGSVGTQASVYIYGLVQKVVEAHLCVWIFFKAFSTHCFQFFPLVKVREQNISFSLCVLMCVLWEPLGFTFLPFSPCVPANVFLYFYFFTI